jgi:AraC-like DNA-binding protein
LARKGVQPVEADSRGILDPWLLRQRVQLNRYPAPEALDGLVDRFWTVRWQLPDGVTHRQQVLTHPAANITVGNPDGTGSSAPVEARLNGVARRVTTRTLVGDGWTVAAMTTPGGLGAFVARSGDFTDRVVPLGAALRVDEAALLRNIQGTDDEKERVAALAVALENAVDPQRAPTARQVASAAHLAETDRSIRRVAQLSSAIGISERTLQRMFAEYAGVSPTWVLRRYRLIDAAESVRHGEPVSWAELAAELGYADQAHLIRDFRSAAGTTPAAYAQSVRENR